MNEANRFLELRHYWNITQGAMAERLGVSRSTMLRYEKGEPPTGEALAALAKLGVNLNWLLTGQGSMMIGEQAPATAEPSLDEDKEKEIVELRAALADERKKTADWKAGATQLLAGCIMAVDQMAMSQRMKLSQSQRAAAITSMFIELGSRSEEEIHKDMERAKGSISQKGKRRP
jgi:transcriptional regulator with XRE-family HTH domain